MRTLFHLLIVCTLLFASFGCKKAKNATQKAALDAVEEVQEPATEKATDAAAKCADAENKEECLKQLTNTKQEEQQPQQTETKAEPQPEQ